MECKFGAGQGTRLALIWRHEICGHRDKMTNMINALSRKLAVLFILVLGVVGVGQIAMAADNQLTGMRLGMIELNGAPALRIVIETRQPATAKLLLLDEPWRLVVDSPDLTWGVAELQSAGALSNGPAAAYRFGHPEPGTGRLVIEMNAPASPERAFTLPPRDKGGYRLVIDLVDKGPTRFKLAQRSLQKDGYAITSAGHRPPADAPADQADIRQPSSQQASVSSPAPRPAQLNRKWIVAIDAGHGGKDPGALGRGGTKEKEITLAAAKQLAADLNKTGKVSARLVRSSDKFFKLRQRIAIARDMGADVFVSLHADSAPRKSARGMSVFTLSDTASDKEAAYIARRENKADLVGGPDLAVEDPAAANALLSMFQRETMNESSRLAAAILSQIKDMPGGDKRGHRFAGFAVLKSPDVPSVLVEMGFLSNAEDEKNLNSAQYRRKLTQRLAKAIVTYLTTPLS